MSDRLATDRERGNNALMQPSPELEAFFELCKCIYERMQREGTWPWPVDTTNPEDVLDSANNPTEP